VYADASTRRRRTEAPADGESPLATIIPGAVEPGRIDPADPTGHRRLWSHRRVRLISILVPGIAGVCLLGMLAQSLGWLGASDAGPLPRYTVLVFLAALACEFIDASLGMGYGTTLSPILLLCGFHPLSVVPCVLLSEFLTGLGAALSHHRDGNADFLRDRRTRGTALLLVSLSVAGTLTAVNLALYLSPFCLTALIGGIVLLVGLATLATIRRQLRFRRWHIVLVGVVAAFNKSLSGGGYGPLVTGGQVVSGMTAKQAVAITSAAEGFTCLIGLLLYLLAGRTIDWSLAVPMTLGALLSVPLATLAVRRLPEGNMRLAVGVVTVLLGLGTLCKLPAP